MNTETENLKNKIEEFFKKEYDEEKDDGKRSKLKPEVWFVEFSKIHKSIYKATHFAKGIHSSASFLNVNIMNEKCIDIPGVCSSFSEKEYIKEDFVASSAGYLGYLKILLKLLSVEHNGSTLEDLIKNDQNTITNVLSLILNKSNDECLEIIDSLNNVLNPSSIYSNDIDLVSLKQLYWEVEKDKYNVIVPLYPSSFVDKINNKIKKDKKDYWEKDDSNKVVHTDLAYVQLGGTKPGNVGGQFVPKRGGKDYLLASFPPQWTSEIKPILKCKNILTRIQYYKTIKESFEEISYFIDNTDYNNYNIRDKRARLFNNIYENIIDIFVSYRTLEPGWSDNSECLLPESQKRLLDYYREDFDNDNDEWVDNISNTVANWINDQINKRLKNSSKKIGEGEHKEWKVEFKKMLKDEGMF